MASGFELIPLTPQKTDPAWKHCEMYKNGTRVHLKCVYCDKLLKGGGIHRIKEHLACIKGNAATCPRVPPDVQLSMRESLNGLALRRKKKQKTDEAISNINPQRSDADTFANQCDVNGTFGVGPLQEQVIEASPIAYANLPGAANKNAVRRKKDRVKISSASHDAMHLSAIDYISKTENDQIDMAIGRFLYDIGAPLSAVNSAYFQRMFNAIASGGAEAAPPTCHDLRGPVLKNAVEEMKNESLKYTSIWGRTGCTLVVEQWNTEIDGTFLSFLVYCPEGSVFLKSVDASAFVDSSEALVEVLKQVVEEVGVTNVLQVITNGEEQYIAAGKRLMDIFPSLYWAPCAAQSIDLILGDFAELEWINEVIGQARSITRFMYSHAELLNLLRRYTGGCDIVALGETCSATNFTTLKRMVDFKRVLQSMVASQDWVESPYSKKADGLEVFDYVSNESFWSSCLLITHLTSPLLRLLKIVRSEKRPAIGYIYAGIYRAKEAIKKQLTKREDYLVYWNIIDNRWRHHQGLPLQLAGFYLNPKFFYSIQGDIPAKFLSAIIDCVEHLVPDLKVQDKIMKEMNLYKSASGDLGRKMAVRAKDTLLPAEWWSTYGGGCPNLMRLATRILSQTCSAARCKRNRISFDQIHTARNGLEHQWLSDMVYVQYNLRLRQVVDKNMERSAMDPLSFESRSLVEDWVAQKDINSVDYSRSDWMEIDLPSRSSTSGPSDDENEDLGAGFSDPEIFTRVKNEADNVDVEDNAER